MGRILNFRDPYQIPGIAVSICWTPGRKFFSLLGVECFGPVKFEIFSHIFSISGDFVGVEYRVVVDFWLERIVEIILVRNDFR